MVEDSKTKDMSKKLVTIIIPAHQAEAFISRSVHSALNQTYPNIEVIVVENGSTDKTVDILHSLKDDRVLVFQSETGVSNARNKGIKEAHGEYLLFLDADDWLEETAVEILMIETKEGADIVSARYFGDKPFEKYQRKRYEPGSNEYFLKCLYTPTKRGNCTGNLYRTSFIKKNKIWFETNLAHAEDTVFFTALLLNKPIVVDLEKPVYHVVYNTESATRGGKKDNTDDFCKAIKKIYEMLSECSSEIKNAGYICALNQLLVIMVNNEKTISDQMMYMKEAFQKNEFSEAIKNLSVEPISGVMKIIFTLMKKRNYFLLAIAIKARALINSWKKATNDLIF